MAAALHDLGEFPDLRYAAERRRIDQDQSFSPDIEAEFIAARLMGNRTLIRVIFCLGPVLAIWRLETQMSNGLVHGPLLIQFCAVFAGSIVLAWLAWSAAFERHFLPWAAVIVPVRNALAAAHFAAAAALGRIELLMVLPMMLVGPFFFMGFRFRTALLSGTMTLAAFTICAALAMPHVLALRCSLFLLVVLLGTVVAALHFEKGSRASFLERYLIAELAQRDALTGMRNRRSFDEHLARIWSQAIAQRRAIAILLIDVDHFKAYNDRYGHLAGDDALRSVAHAVRGLIRRPDDVLARYGGEEFVAILQGADAGLARRAAEQMRRAVMDLAIEHRASPTFTTVTISVGVAAIEPNASRDCRGALQLADQALYQAKLRGRNGVELMDDAEYRLLQTGVFRADTTNAVSQEEASRERGAAGKRAARCNVG